MQPIRQPEIIPQEINVQNVMALTARLAQVLAQEVDLLAEMKVHEIEPLQKEKITLTKALEMQLKRVQKYPELLDSIHPDDRDELRDLISVFEEIKEENYHRLLAAREVNKRVVEAITEAVNEQNKKPTYSEDGHNLPQFDSISITLNKTI
jgi:hypothetical protein